MSSGASRLPTVAVVLAGGVGARMGASVPKQLLRIAGKTVIEHTIAALDASPEIDELVVMMEPHHLEAIDAIRRDGLYPMRRLHVHLSADEATAVEVGRRHGKPAVLLVRAAALAAAGQRFYRSENGVWLTAAVAPEFIDFPDPLPPASR